MRAVASFLGPLVMCSMCVFATMYAGRSAHQTLASNCEGTLAADYTSSKSTGRKRMHPLLHRQQGDMLTLPSRLQATAHTSHCINNLRGWHTLGTDLPCTSFVDVQRRQGEGVACLMPILMAWLLPTVADTSLAGVPPRASTPPCRGCPSSAWQVLLPTLCSCSTFQV